MSNKFTLICTVYNEIDSISLFLDSYSKQTLHAPEFIIVDGGSTDGTSEFLIDYSIKHQDLNIEIIVDYTCNKSYVKGPIGRGRNVAISRAKYDWIVSTDAGCILDKNWLSTINNHISNGIADVIGGY